MNELEKLLAKMKKTERIRVLNILERLREGDISGLKIQKLKNSKFYRLRAGRFRIIVSLNKKTKTFIIENVRLRNESTYR